MLLDAAHDVLGWPKASDVLKPAGWGAKIYAELARQKVGDALMRKFPRIKVRAGVLVADPNSRETQAPVAIVCEFPKPVGDDVLRETHKLAWNFSRTELLLTLEPHRLLAWSCCQEPFRNEQDKCVVGDLNAEAELFPESVAAKASESLHWINLLTGELLRRYPKKFQTERRADALLLSNLRFIRARLLELNLPREICHDLLARIIFTQFLFQRTDSEGRLALDEKLLQSRFGGRLKMVHTGLASILSDKDDTYELFRWLDERFNGDLFPGGGRSSKERERAWQLEKDAVQSTHLKELSDFISGEIVMGSGQRTLWKHYSFDTIPLEFISSVYEQFVSDDRDRSKAYYTKAHLVDFVLDGVLPWDGDTWNLRVLDPACGSGIFLVKAFQRLIQRWRNANGGADPTVPDIKPILSKCIHGVDQDSEAVRVACFSLYLAMCDAIDPRHYWKTTVFPLLRDKTLISADFFEEERAGIRTDRDAGTYDLVIGNAPWGRNSIKMWPTANAWATTHSWPVADGDFGPLFLAKAVALTKQGGDVSIVQPASTWLYLRSGHAQALRKKLFAKIRVDEVANFSAMRRELFSDAVGPACVISCRSEQPRPDGTLHYIYPKPQKNQQDRYRIIIDPQDVHELTPEEAAGEPEIWTALAMGSRRDWHLLKTLSERPNLKKWKAKKLVRTREGVIRGDRGRREKQIVELPILSTPDFPPTTFLELDASALPPNDDPMVDSVASNDFSAFYNPQLLIKQTFKVERQRFQAALVKSNDPKWGAICSQSYLSVHDTREDGAHIRAAWLACNSRLAAYYLLASSSRLGHYRPEVLTRELEQVPLPDADASLLKGIYRPSDVDRRIRKLFDLKESEWALVEDLLDITFQDALGAEASPGRQRTCRWWSKRSGCDDLDAYADFFVRVLRSNFGRDKPVCVTIFEESNEEYLPVRLVAIHLDWPDMPSVRRERIGVGVLKQRLSKFYDEWLSIASHSEGIHFQRVARLFQMHRANGCNIPTVFLIKPDQRRYWTRSLALRDADQVSVEIAMSERGDIERA
jgi:hypothetical protein